MMNAEVVSKLLESNWFRHTVLLAVVVCTCDAAHAWCERTWRPGNFKLTETYPFSCPADPGIRFAGEGYYESLQFGKGRFVVSEPVPANELGNTVHSLDNHARLEFHGFAAVLGSAGSSQTYFNRGEWHLTDGHGISSAGPGIRFYNNGRFVKSGAGTSVASLPFFNGSGGTLEVSSGGLHFTQAFLSYQGASIRIASGSSLSFADGMYASVENVVGGRLVIGKDTMLHGHLSQTALEGAAGSRLRYGTRLQDTTIAGVVNVGPDVITRSVHVFAEGQINVEGRLQFLGGSVDGGYTSELDLRKKTVLAGKGETVFGGNGYNIVFSSGEGHLTVAAGHTLRGSASLNIGNNGEAHVWRNEGTLRAEGEKGIRIHSNRGGIDNAGLIEIANGSRLHVQQGWVRGGEVRGEGTASLSGHRFADLTLQGQLTLGAGSTTHISGRITNQGLLTFSSPSGMGAQLIPAQLSVSGATLLDGAGLTRMAPRTAIFSFDGSGMLTLGPEQKLIGVGSIGFISPSRADLQAFTVLGSLQTEAGQGLSVAVPSAKFVNKGAVDVVAQSFLFSRNSFVQQGELAALHVDGHLTAPDVLITSGTLSGAGTIKGNVELQGGTLSPGNSPGTLRIDGNLLMGPDAMLAIELGHSGQDRLLVSGRAELGGKLLISLAPEAKLGDSFEFLSAAQGFAGRFAEVSAQGFQLTGDYSGGAVRFTVTGVSPIPEPDTYLLFMAGLLTLPLLRRRRGQYLATNADRA